jgi:SEC-C motif-containing protein
MEIEKNDECPCCSGKEYGECCGPYISGEKHAPTPEALMRSRYSAFALEEVDYVLGTHDPATRSEVDPEEVQAWSEQSEWTGLNILKTTGSEEDEKGEVEFVAHYFLKNKEQRHHERAQFTKKDGRWFFTDGEFVNTTFQRQNPKVGRNDPCPCGSGKKYKKCCGA